MTEQQAITEVLNDLPLLLAYTETVTDRLFRKEVLKASVYPIYRRWRWKSRKGNDWTIIYEARSRKEIGDMSRITFYLTANFFKRFVFMPTWTNGKQEVIIYTPHFFSRFSERCNIDLSGLNLTDRFFKLNSSYVFDVVDKTFEKDGNMMQVTEVHGSCKEGVALGYRTVEGNLFFKTFISYEMLKGEQVKTFTENEQIRKEIHET